MGRSWMYLASGIALFAAGPLAAQTALEEGDWSAVVSVESDPPPLEFLIRVTTVDGEPQLAMMSPDGQKLEPLVEVVLEGDALSFAWPGVDSQFSLSRETDGRWAGDCQLADGAGSVTARMTLLPPTPGAPSSGVASAGTSSPAESVAEAPAPVSTLADLLALDLDADLHAELEFSRQAATEWQDDARLHEVRLNVSDKGRVSWRFHWLSNAAQGSRQFFSSSRSLRIQRTDAEASEKATLELGEMVGFNRLGEILAAGGVDLAATEVDSIQTLELSFQDWRRPVGYYYYLFLTSGAQHWIEATTGTLQ